MRAMHVAEMVENGLVGCVDVCTTIVLTWVVALTLASKIDASSLRLAGLIRTRQSPCVDQLFARHVLLPSLWDLAGILSPCIRLLIVIEPPSLITMN